MESVEEPRRAPQTSTGWAISPSSRMVAVRPDSPFDCGDAVVGLNYVPDRPSPSFDLALSFTPSGNNGEPSIMGDFDLRFAGRLEHGEELVDALDRRVAPFVLLLAAGLRVVACG